MINLDFESLQTIGLTPYIAQQLLMLNDSSPESFPARVIEIHRDRYVLHNGKNELQARSFPNADVGKLAVGDWIIAEPYEIMRIKLLVAWNLLHKLLAVARKEMCNYL